MALEKLELSKLQAELQQSDAEWQAGVTSVSELSEEEQRLYLGYIPGPGEPSLDASGQVTHTNLAAVGTEVHGIGAPTAYDLRNVDGKNFITSVKNQGACGSGVAFAIVAAVEGTFRVQRGDPNLAIDLSEAHLFYCHARAQGRTCSTGWWIDPALDAFKNPGVADEACYPYVGGDQNCSNLCEDWQSRVTKITAWHTITSPAEMKTWLSTRGPLVTAFNVYSDFYSYKSGVYRHVTGSSVGGMIVCCVGYNDAGGYWICKTSWSTAWGEGGFFKIAYGEGGIDAKMYAIDGIEETGWLNDKRITGLWANSLDRNAWVYIAG
ncbi:MAG: C1 family peptidase, partial [Blastocatellia bacterium]